ncbi:hypothetical protein SAY87_024024 [Trapa incisa]|uniref:Secreted protein n=1 Tax=Trapa incisa TaxID=236973 RepID=A0AAN7L4G2_9MYRT|nr:hypothetical protein SAY87_024024 [Trapa incisa]
MKGVGRLLCVIFFALMVFICGLGCVPAEATGRLRFEKPPRESIVPKSSTGCRKNLVGEVTNCLIPPHDH